VTVAAAHLTGRDFRRQRDEAGFAPRQLHDRITFCPYVVVLQYQRVREAAVDALSPRELFVDPENVPFTART